MPTSTPERLVRTYQSRLLAIRQTAGVVTARAWTLANVDDAAAGRFVQRATAISTAAQSRTSALVDSYVSAMLAEPPKGITPPIGPLVRNGTPTEDVYHRAIVEARTKLAEGKSWTEAMRAGGARAVSSAETDVMLTQRQALVDRADASPRVHGYRRVLTGKSCMFCATVSTQRYHKSELMPLHNHCDCTVAPIVDGTDPGQIINQDLLRALKGAGGSKYWKDRGLVEVDGDGNFIVQGQNGQKRVLKVAQHDHGELGPVLSDHHDHFQPEPGHRARPAKVLHQKPEPVARQAQQVLTDEQYAALKPRGWSLPTLKKARAALQSTPNGKGLSKLLDSFQSGGARGIPRLRTDIEKYLVGGELEPGRVKQIETLLDAIRGSPLRPKKLYRGMQLDGDAASVLERYAGNHLDLNLSSFTSDRKRAKDFATDPAGQRTSKGKTKTSVIFEVEDARGLPIEMHSKSGFFCEEREWLSGGRFDILESKLQKDGSVLVRLRQTALLGD